MTNESNSSHKPGGYENLIVYWLASDIYDLTVTFCRRYISLKSRTYDQMVQAARSGKQNIVEGSLEQSIESCLKLTGVARASYGELLEDYRDYLRQNKLPIWLKDDPRVLEIRTHKTNRSYKSNKTYESYLINNESYGNLMITLCFKEGYLLDCLLKSINDKFIKEGGFREKLFRKRINYLTGKKLKLGIGA